MFILNKLILNLKLLRSQHNLSQREVADRIGVSYRTYQRIESGESELSISSLMALSKLYCSGPFEFMKFVIDQDDVDAMNKCSDELTTNILNSYTKMNQQEANTLNKFDQFKGFLDSFDQDYDSRIDIFDFIKTYDPFRNSDLVLFITDFEHTIVNPKGSSLLPENMIMKKYRAGRSWLNQQEFQRFLNAIFMKSNLGQYFIKDVEHHVDGNAFLASQCHYFNHGGKYDAFSPGYVFDVRPKN